MTPWHLLHRLAAAPAEAPAMAPIRDPVREVRRESVESVVRRAENRMDYGSTREVDDIDGFLRDAVQCEEFVRLADAHPQHFDDYTSKAPIVGREIAEACGLRGALARDRAAVQAEGYTTHRVDSFEDLAAQRRARRAWNAAHPDGVGPGEPPSDR